MVHADPAPIHAIHQAINAEVILLPVSPTKFDQQLSKKGKILLTPICVIALQQMVLAIPISWIIEKPLKNEINDLSPRLY